MFLGEVQLLQLVTAGRTQPLFSRLPLSAQMRGPEQSALVEHFLVQVMETHAPPAHSAPEPHAVPSGLVPADNTGSQIP